MNLHVECHSATDDRDAQIRENYERKRTGRPGVWNTIRETVVLRARERGSLYPNATIEAHGRFDEDETADWRRFLREGEGFAGQICYPSTIRM